MLRVRLFGPPEARIAQAARIENVDVPTARQRLPLVDRAARNTCGGSTASTSTTPDLYQLQIDSTVLPLDACAGLIVAAYTARAGG